MEFLRFEVRKFLNNPKNRIVLAIFTMIFLGLFGFHQTIWNAQRQTMVMNTVKLNIQQVNQSVIELERYVLDNSSDDSMKKLLEDARTEYSLLTQQVTALESNDVLAFSDLDFQLDQLRLSTLSQEENPEEYQSIVARIHYHEAVKKVGGQAPIAINDSDGAAFFTGVRVLSWLSSTAILILFTVLLSDGVSSDIEDSQLNLYALVGRKNKLTLVVKLMVPVIITFAFTVSLFCLIYLIKGGIDGFGVWNYPYLSIGQDIFPIWEVVLKSLINAFLSLVFIASLGQLLSFIFRKSTVVIGMISLFLVAFMTFSKEEWFQPIKPFLPFEYMSYAQLMNDAEVLPAQAFTIGVLYLSSLSILFVIISNILYRNYYWRKAGK